MAMNRFEPFKPLSCLELGPEGIEPTDFGSGNVRTLLVRVCRDIKDGMLVAERGIRRSLFPAPLQLVVNKLGEEFGYNVERALVLLSVRASNMKGGCRP